MRHKIWIDRGGTFTDCIGLDTVTGQLTVLKLLSSQGSVIEGIREVLGLPAQAELPPCDVRMGTTIATNALLERKGCDCLLVTSRGFADVPEIGTQARQDLFALAIEKPAPLHSAVVEVDLRCTKDGDVLGNFDALAFEAELAQQRRLGSKSLAVVLLHAHTNGAPERALGDLARKAGFEHVALSHEVISEIGLLGRGDTTSVDAYLTPLLGDYLKSIRGALTGGSLRVMQSSGGLASAERLRGPNAILSGPAGGVVAYSAISSAAGYSEVIGFDMGGTSTDVSRFAGEYERRYENEVAGVRLRAPMLAIHTVAAGGGSLCRYDGQKFSVGPDSAGADPGPLCYGAPHASEPSVTDVNLVLGRLLPDRFPFPLQPERSEAAFAAIAARVSERGSAASASSVAEGFFEIANLNMAEAIRRVSIARGYDVRTHALFVFGGAGGQHACALARMLGMRTVLFHELSGVLSAYGMGLADVVVHAQADMGARALDEAALEAARKSLDRLEADACGQLEADGHLPSSFVTSRLLDLRYRGTETALTLPIAPLDELESTFTTRHAREFGYARPGHPLELCEVRLEAVAKSPAVVLDLPHVDGGGAPVPLRQSRLRHAGRWLEDVPVFAREHLESGQRIRGPAVILESTGTIVVDPGFTLLARGALLVVTDEAPACEERAVALASNDAREPDPILLEVMNHQYMSIAEQMGSVLQRTALSTNIRERLDFSCAVFDRQARLIANAPHIPVHLGAMGESVAAIVDAYPDPAPGDAFITNDPSHGGSHLPDVTVVTPVHDEVTGALAFFVASRGHHADIGGITPGSMPAASTRLAEEGVVLPALRIVRGGIFDRELLLQKLGSGPHPARRPSMNLADIEAKLAANRLGATRLCELVARHGLALVHEYMNHVRDNAEQAVRRAIDRIPDGDHCFEDALDNGARIAVRVSVHGSEMHIDFTGTDPELASNLNAPRAVTAAAVIYFLRTLVDTPIPLNSGCLGPVTLLIPEGCLLSPSPGAAVVGGNVETSQRIVDVLLGAVAVAAASQGTMNNLSFGNDSFGYYETLAGGAGAGPGFSGASCVHTHMTNTRITDPEVLETHYPVRVHEFSRRRGSGGAGRHRGGDGLVRDLEFLAPVQVSLLTERRVRAPFGLAGGHPGQRGQNLLNGAPIAGAIQLDLAPGARLRIETPGGGGYGAPMPVFEKIQNRNTNTNRE